MKLKLKKPLVVFDLETTGLSLTHDRIVELGYIKIMPNGEEQRKNYRFNPGMPIPPESTQVHGISDEDVKNCPTFKEKAREIAAIFQGCDFAGFNSNHFDVPLLGEEFLRAEVNFDWSKVRFIDVQTIFHKKEPRTLSAAYRFYCNKEYDPHHADNDTEATYEVLQAQLDKYPDLENDATVLANFSSEIQNIDLAGRIIKNSKGEAIFNFGKYKGQTVSEIFKKDPGYFGWVMSSDFTANTKQVLTKIKLGHEI